jgi:hypothetical protein
MNSTSTVSVIGSRGANGAAKGSISYFASSPVRSEVYCARPSGR